MNICIIPARGGSKRIQKKNIRDFFGKPMIAWPLRVVTESGLFDKVVVSTDDPNIAQCALKFGAEVPFTRPPSLSDDLIDTDSVVLHAVQQCIKIFGRFDRGCCIYATNPFLSEFDLKKGLEILNDTNSVSAFPVVRYEFPIQQAIKLSGFSPVPKWPEKMNKRSQDLEEYFHDAGMFYWFDVLKFLENKQLISSEAAAFPIEAARCQDINTEADWKQAELKFKLFMENNTL